MGQDNIIRYHSISSSTYSNYNDLLSCLFALSSIYPNIDRFFFVGDSAPLFSVLVTHFPSLSFVADRSTEVNFNSFLFSCQQGTTKIKANYRSFLDSALLDPSCLSAISLLNSYFYLNSSFSSSPSPTKPRFLSSPSPKPWVNYL
jgi:hypothetical protein